VIVRAPATSANLGPGFDSAAVALDLWNELEITEGEGVAVEGEGADELSADDSNLAILAFALLGDPSGKRFRFVNRIPLERGLGSSAAAIALGLAAAQPDASAEELLATGRTLEGHSDNLAAALLGGVTLTWEGRIARIADALPLTPVALVPRERTSTEASRRSLPANVPHGDAAANAARAALLAAGAATADPELFAAGLDDRLHEPYRPSPVLDAVRDELPPGARGATLSGSGPTVIVWADDRDACAASLAERFPEHDVLPLAVAPRGAL
jgi:homoserine kinase